MTGVAIGAGSIGTAANAAVVTDTARFVAVDQSMWGSGDATIFEFNTFLGSTWNKTSKSGKITTVRDPIFGTVLGKAGAEIRGSTRGKVGVEFDFFMDSGSVDADIRYSGGLAFPDPDELVGGQAFTLSSFGNLQSTSAFTTNFPEFRISADMIFEVFARLGATACVLACASGDRTLIDTKIRQELIGINRDGDGKVGILRGVPLFERETDLGIGFEAEPGVVVGGGGDEDTDTKKEKKKQNVKFVGIPIEVDINFPNIDTVGTVAGNSLTSEGEDDFIKVAVDLDGIATNIMGAPPLEGSISIGGVAGFSYNILDVETGPIMVVTQDFKVDPTLFLDLEFAAAVQRKQTFVDLTYSTAGIPAGFSLSCPGSAEVPAGTSAGSFFSGLRSSGVSCSATGVSLGRLVTIPVRGTPIAFNERSVISEITSLTLEAGQGVDLLYDGAPIAVDPEFRIGATLTNETGLRIDPFFSVEALEFSASILGARRSLGPLFTETLRTAGVSLPNLFQQTFGLNGTTLSGLSEFLIGEIAGGSLPPTEPPATPEERRARVLGQILALSQFLTGGVDGDPIPGWIIDGEGTAGIVNDPLRPGNLVVEMVTGSPVSITTLVSTPENVPWYLDFDFLFTSSTGVLSFFLIDPATFDELLVGSLKASNFASNVWHHFHDRMTGFLGLTDVAFVFRWDAGTPGATVLLDNIKLEVPEPGVMLLLAPGLVLLALVRRRRGALARAA